MPDMQKCHCAKMMVGWSWTMACQVLTCSSLEDYQIVTHADVAMGPPTRTDEDAHTIGHVHALKKSTCLRTRTCVCTHIRMHARMCVCTQPQIQAWSQREIASCTHMVNGENMVGRENCIVRDAGLQSYREAEQWTNT
jgi:hypothetical protein